jgi:hypothetical protein
MELHEISLRKIATGEIQSAKPEDWKLSVADAEREALRLKLMDEGLSDDEIEERLERYDEGEDEEDLSYSLGLPKGKVPLELGGKGKAKCEHQNEDGTFAGGFDGCVAHMQAECGGGHSEESAKKICGTIAANKNLSLGGLGGKDASAHGGSGDSDSEFEDKHPRGEGGKFASKGEGKDFGPPGEFPGDKSAHTREPGGKFTSQDAGEAVALKPGDRVWIKGDIPGPGNEHSGKEGRIVTSTGDNHEIVDVKSGMKLGNYHASHLKKDLETDRREVDYHNARQDAFTKSSAAHYTGYIAKSPEDHAKAKGQALEAQQAHDKAAEAAGKLADGKEAVNFHKSHSQYFGTLAEAHAQGKHQPDLPKRKGKAESIHLKPHYSDEDEETARSDVAGGLSHDPVKTDQDLELWFKGCHGGNGGTKLEPQAPKPKTEEEEAEAKKSPLVADAEKRAKAKKEGKTLWQV